jgi:hypothetical protein
MSAYLVPTYAYRWKFVYSQSVPEESSHQVAARLIRYPECCTLDPGPAREILYSCTPYVESDGTGYKQTSRGASHHFPHQRSLLQLRRERALKSRGTRSESRSSSPAELALTASHSNLGTRLVDLWARSTSNVVDFPRYPASLQICLGKVQHNAGRFVRKTLPIPHGSWTRRHCGRSFDPAMT